VLEETIQRLVDIEEIKQLKARYCRFVAAENWDEFEALFTEDLQFITPDGTVYQGRDNFMAFHIERIQKPKAKGVLHCFTPEIIITGADTATGTWAMYDLHEWPTSEGTMTGYQGYGHYHEDYVRTKDGWRFKRVENTRVRTDPLTGGPPDFWS
jgi:uncharacterized protein (TIGR02246 family)